MFNLLYLSVHIYNELYFRIRIFQKKRENINKI